MNRYRVALGGIAIMAVVIVLLATRWGIATSSDSARYIRSARHALGREAVVQSPIEAPAEQAHYPPGYSTLLVLASLGGADPLGAARWLQALLMAANVVIAGELVRRATGSHHAALFTALLSAIAPASVFIHTWALSEPLFILLMLLTMALLAAHVARPRRNALIGAGLLCGAAVLTRYAGVSLIPAGALALLLLQRERVWRVRGIDAAIFLACALAPPALWSLRNALVLGSTTNRVIAFHPVTLAHLGDAARTFCDWLFVSDHLGVPLRAVATVAFLIVLAYASIIGWRRGRGAILAGVILIFITVFALTLAWSISFVDYHTPVDVRILSPIHAVWIVLIGILLATARARSKAIVTIAWTAAILLAANSMIRSFQTVRDMHRDGAGFAHAIWRNSATIREVKKLPPEHIIYTNAPGAVYLLTGYPLIITIPSEFSASSRLPNPEYDESMARIAADLQAGRAVIVYLKRYARSRWYYPTEAELKKRLGLHPRARLNDGTIWDYVPPVTPTTAPATRP